VSTWIILVYTNKVYEYISAVCELSELKALEEAPDNSSRCPNHVIGGIK
jgi:hypothetical protein